MNFNPIGLGDAYGAIDKYFGNTLAGLGYGGSVMSANPAFFQDPTVNATMLDPGFQQWAQDNGISASLGKGSDYNILRLMQGDNVLAEKQYTTKNGLDKFAEVAGPIALAIGTGGVLGQALGFLNPALNPLDSSTWGSALNSGASAGGGSIDAAFADMMAQGGTLMPEGAGTLLSNSAAALDPALLAGGALGGGVAAGALGGASGAVGGAWNGTDFGGAAASSAVPAAASGGGLLSGLGSAAGLAKAALPIAGAIAGSKPSGGGTQTVQSKTDPRLDPYLYGDQGILSQAQQWFKANQQPNQAMQKGWDMQMGLLSDPNVLQQLGQMRSSAMGLLGGPVAGNGFSSFYGG